jgi:hypothetical protein
MCFAMTEIHAHTANNPAPENFALLDYYAASSCNFLLMFRENLSVQFFLFLTLKKEPIGCPVMLVRNYHYLLNNNPEECSSHLLHGGNLQSILYLFPCHFKGLWIQEKKANQGICSARNLRIRFPVFIIIPQLITVSEFISTV